MKKNLLLTGTLALTMFAQALYAQDASTNTPAEQQLLPQCGTVAPGEEWENWLQARIKEYEANQSSNKTQAVVTIPVIVHILHNKKAVGVSENIAKAQVEAMINVMNNAFSGNAVGNSSLPAVWANVDANDIPIQFCLAAIDKNGNNMAEAGIERLDVSAKGWGDPSSTTYIKDYATLQSYFNSKVKPATIWDPTKYFNIWLGNFISNSGGYLGYATFPPSSTLSGIPGAPDVGTSTTDGVVMGTGVFGDKAKYPSGFYYNDNGYVYGITSLHEVGHYLGLRHISGDAACGSDYVSDTPPQKGGNAGAQNGLNWRCPTHPFQKNSCSGNPDGEMFQNFMDYSDDGCRSLFTAGQETRMMTALTNSPNRKLLGTHGLCSPNGIAAPSAILQNIAIYPNPSTGIFTMDGMVSENGKCRMEVRNALGQLVYIETITGQRYLNNKQVDLSTMPQGVYLIQLNSDMGSVTKRIIIQ